MVKKLTEENQTKKEDEEKRHGKHAGSRYRWWFGTAFPKEENMSDENVFEPNLKGRWYKCWWERGETDALHAHFLIYSENGLTKGDCLCKDDRFKHPHWERVLTNSVTTVANYETRKIKEDGTVITKKHVKTYTSQSDTPEILIRQLKYTVKKEIMTNKPKIIKELTDDDKAAIGNMNLKIMQANSRIIRNYQIDLNKEREAWIEIRYGQTRGGKSHDFQIDPNVCMIDETMLRGNGDVWYDPVLDYDNPKTIVLNEFGSKTLRITNALSLIDNTPVIRPVKGDRIRVDCQRLVYIVNNPITLFFNYEEEASKCEAFGERIRSVRYYYKKWTKKDPDTFVEVKDLYITFLNDVKKLYEDTKDHNKEVHFDQIKDKYEIAVLKRVETAAMQKGFNRREVKVDDNEDKINNENLNEIGNNISHKLSDINKVFSLKL